MTEKEQESQHCNAHIVQWIYSRSRRAESLMHCAALKPEYGGFGYKYWKKLYSDGKSLADEMSGRIRKELNL